MNSDENKSKPDKVNLAKPKDGENREEFTRRVIKQLRERGLITGDEKPEQAEDTKQ
ncbi:MAG: hypothetical protein P8P36_08110 [Akkermansiaceae bacterium]|nr:hypothetical protein [Akkermansiaceae bacterium]